MTTLERLSDFALSLRRESNIEGSSVCSPLSIGLVLALLHAGANGATKSQITHALAKGASDEDVQKMLNMSMQLSKTAAKGAQPLVGVSFSSSSEAPSGVEVSVANRIYLGADISIEQDYLAAIKKNYSALAEIVDFSKANEAAKTINSFVNTSTKGKIVEIVEAEKITKDTVAVLVNAIYLNAKWQKPFRPCGTWKDDFFAGNSVKRKVRMMMQTDRFMYTETNEVQQVLSMKYVDESYAYDVFLPKKTFAGGLDSFLAGLNGTKMQTLLQSMRLAMVQVTLPKSRIETSLNLKETLIKLGIKDAFDPDAADLSGISKDETKPRLYVTRVIHKAVIEVDEQGTTAAAATIGKGRAGCLPKVFTANRPYFYTLSKDNAPVFMGTFR